MTASIRAAAIVLCVLLSACAATGTRVTTNSEGVRGMANSQQWWCSSMGNASGCGCTIDGKPATCSLVQSCLSAGTCQAQR